MSVRSGRIWISYLGDEQVHRLFVSIEDNKQGEVVLVNSGDHEE
jgi:hypothetical protein